MTAIAIAEAVASGSVAVSEVIDAQVRLIEERAADVNPFTTVVAEGAVAAARSADARLADGGRPRPLEGVPITIKDSFDVAGERTTVGRSADSHLAVVDAPMVARLRAAGAIVVAKTNVPVMLDDYQTENAEFGRTLNPWNTGHSPGGSSGGAAAAIATGLSFGDLGSDLYGSIRMPAAWCGIFGHRPSNGVLSKLGHLPWPVGSLLEPPLSTVGPLAGSAADLQRLFHVLAGTPEAPAGTAPPARVGLWLDDPVAPLTSGYRRALLDFSGRLEDAGAEVVVLDKTPVGGVASLDLFDRLMGAELAHNYAPHVARELAQGARSGDPDLLWARHLDQSASELWRIWEEQRRLTARWTGIFAMKALDVVLAPAAHGAAPKWDALPMADRTLDLEGTTWRAVDLVSAWSRLTNVGMGPATVVPIGLDEGSGLPFGVQILGPNHRDGTTLAAAVAWERAGLVTPLSPPATAHVE